MYKGNKEILSLKRCCVIETFAKGVLRIAINNKDFVRSEPTEFVGTRLSEIVIQAIQNDEAIAAIDTSVKDEKIGGAWIVEDDHRVNK